MSGSPLSSGQAATRSEHPMHNSRYRRWLLGSAVSMFGDQFYLIALPWLVLQLGSTAMLGTVMMVGGLPRAALMLVGGAVTDRMSARRIMLAAAAARAVCLAAIGGLTWLRMLCSWEVYGLVLVFGVADAFAIPAQIAYVPALISEDHLAAALSFGQGVEVVAYTVGPIPAGLIVSHFGAGFAFIIDAAGFLVVIAALFRLPDPPVTAQVAPMAAINEGIVEVFRDISLRTMMLLVAAANLCGLGAVTVGFAALANSRFGSSTAYGVILSAESAGVLMGTLAGGYWKTGRRGWVILGCLALTGVGLLSTPFVPNVLGVAAVQVVSGAAGGLSNLHVMTWIMQRADAVFRGRITSVLMLSSLGMAPVSMGLSGFLATWSVTGLFVLSGTYMLAVALGAAFIPSVRGIR